MYARCQILIAALLLTLTAVSPGQDAPATTDEEAKPAVPAKSVPDLCRGVVDPYDKAAERSRFFKAAGVDNELSSKEAEANRTADKPFVRKFDRWTTMAAFDKDTSKTLDWYEADAYRQALRRRILVAFDENKDSRLAGKERIAANRTLAAGKVPAGTERSTIWVPDRSAPDGKDDATRRAGTVIVGPEGSNVTVRRIEPGQENWREQWQKRQEQRRKEMLEKYDANGNGEFDAAEREKMSDDYRKRAEEQRKQWELQRYDANKDGELDEQELAKQAADREEREKRMAEYRAQAEERRKKWIAEWDADGDGELGEDERKAMQDTYRRRADEARQEYIKKWDADGNGELSDEERQASRDEYRQRSDDRRKAMDTDGDGRVTSEEYRGYREALEKKYDADGDGELSNEERTKMYKEEYGTSGGMMWQGGGRGGFSGRGGPRATTRIQVAPDAGNR
jgi:Ca2+-binding EF-hand superfamily protein